MDAESDEGCKTLADRLNNTHISKSSLKSNEIETAAREGTTCSYERVGDEAVGEERQAEHETINKEIEETVNQEIDKTNNACDIEKCNETDNSRDGAAEEKDSCEDKTILNENAVTTESDTTEELDHGAGNANVDDFNVDKSCDNFVDSSENLADESEESCSDTEYESADEGEEIQADTQNLRELEESLTEEEKEERRKSAQVLKEEGNEYFRNGSYKTAIKTYSRALRTCPLKYAKDRAIMYSNRGACKMRMDDNENAIRDCSKAVELHPHYLKALMRRAELYEKMEKLDEALADFQKIYELDPSQHSARAACARLPDMIKDRNEKLKEEMMSKLKDLGNMVLRPFGLSTNNFNLNQDPNTGGYSVNFVQSPDQNS